jgi:hypothetical protein
MQIKSVQSFASIVLLGYEVIHDTSTVSSVPVFHLWLSGGCLPDSAEFDETALVKIYRKNLNCQNLSL